MKTETQLMEEAIGMQDFSRLLSLAHAAIRTRHIDGDFVEFGCNKGRTAAFLTRLIPRNVWLYDSFEGLPNFGEQNNILKPGTLRADVEHVLSAFRDADLETPHIVKGWFAKIAPEQLPKQIAFAHLDGDLYGSIYDALNLVYPRLAKGAICFIDDYGTELDYFKGVDLAVQDFMRDRPEEVVHFCGTDDDKKNSHGYFIKE